jgi:hypothetical protein
LRNSYKILVGKPKGKRALVRLWLRGEGYIRMDAKERVEICKMDSSGLG